MILGASILQLPVILKAKEMGLSVIAVDMNPDAVGFKEEGVVKEVVSTIDIPKVLEIARRHRIDGVMTAASDMPIRTVAAVAKELDLVGMDMDTAVKATNKVEMRKALREHHVPIPKFFKVGNEQEYEAAVSGFDVPFVVKPVDNSGSRGIYRLVPGIDWDQMLQAYTYSKKFSRNGDVIVEEFMEGKEVSVETISVDGVCHVVQITDKLTTGAPHFVEMGHSQPTQHNPEMIAKIKEAAIEANHAIGIINDPSHTEIMVTADGPKIVEIGARMGGDCIATHLVPLSTGVDLVKDCIQIAVGEKPDIVRKFEKGSAIRYFKQHAGVVRRISGLEDAKSLDGVQQISIVHGIGEYVKEIENSGDRMGFVIAQGRTAEDAISICEQAVEKIGIDIG